MLPSWRDVMVKPDGAPNRAVGYHYGSKPEISMNWEVAIFCELCEDFSEKQLEVTQIESIS